MNPHGECVRPAMSPRTLRPLGSLPFFPGVRLGDGVMTQQPWDRRARPEPAMPTALWRCGLAKCLPRHAGEGRGPVVLRPIRHGHVGHSGHSSAMAGSAGIVRTERTGAGDPVSARLFDSSVPHQKWPNPLVHHEPLMIGTMNPLSRCFAVLSDLPAQLRCPSDRNRGGHHEPLMMTTMKPLSWHFLR
jgi:hypothetical protein